MIYAWINLAIYTVSWVIWAYMYLISIQPMKKVDTMGEKGWEYAAKIRKWALIPAMAQMIAYGLWFFFPVDNLIWRISPQSGIPIAIGIGIGLIFTPIMIIGEKDAGKETVVPSKETQMYGGIYRYIRHPQTLGEWPLFWSMAFITNSWFMVLLSTLFIVGYTPIMIHYEEIDLIKRFGDPYRDYQKRTGALIPKFRKKNN